MIYETYITDFKTLEDISAEVSDSRHKLSQASVPKPIQIVLNTHTIPVSNP